MAVLGTSTYSFSSLPASGGTTTFSYTSPANTKLLVFSLFGSRSGAVTNNCIVNVRLDTKQFTECVAAHYASNISMCGAIWCLTSEQIDGSYTGTLTITSGASSSSLSRPGVCQVTAFDDDFVPIRNARQGTTSTALSLTQDMHFISGFVFSTIISNDTIDAAFATGETVVQSRAVADSYTAAAGYRYGSGGTTLTTTFSSANSVRRMLACVYFGPRLSNGLRISEGTYKASTFPIATGVGTHASSYTHGWYKAPANADAVVFFLSFNAWDTAASRDISSVTWGGVSLTELGRSTDATVTDTGAGVDTFVFHLISDNFPANREGLVEINVNTSFNPTSMPCLIIRPLAGFKNFRAGSFSAAHWTSTTAQTETRTGTVGDLILGYAAISGNSSFSLTETDPITSGLTSQFFGWIQAPDGTGNPRPTYGSLASATRTQASQNIVFDTASYTRNTRAIVEFQPVAAGQNRTLTMSSVGNFTVVAGLSVARTLTTTSVGNFAIATELRAARTLSLSSVSNISIQLALVVARSLTMSADGNVAVVSGLRITRSLTTASVGSVAVVLAVSIARSLLIQSVGNILVQAAFDAGSKVLEMVSQGNFGMAAVLRVSHSVSPSSQGSIAIVGLVSAQRNLAPQSAGSFTADGVLSVARLLAPQSVGSFVAVGSGLTAARSIQPFSQGNLTTDLNVGVERVISVLLSQGNVEMGLGLSVSHSLDPISVSSVTVVLEFEGLTDGDGFTSADRLRLNQLHTRLSDDRALNLDLLDAMALYIEKLAARVGIGTASKISDTEITTANEVLTQTITDNGDGSYTVEES